MTPTTTTVSAPKTLRTSRTRLLSLCLLPLLVLTGCGGKKELPALPEPTTASASATESTEAAGEAINSSVATAGASASEAQNYSGGSKAPAGEYRPADELGPAQNVPKPVEPEGMNVESEEGLEKFLAYWEYSVNYAIQTGDTSYAEKLISEDYKIEQEYYAWLEEVYDRGGWVAGGLRDVRVGDNLLSSRGNGEYSWAGVLYVVDMYAYLGEHKNYIDNSSTANEPVIFGVSYRDGKWVLESVSVSEVSGGE